MLIVWFALQRKKRSTWRWLVARAETCRWEKLCKNIWLIKKLNKLYLTIFYLHILWLFCVACL